MFCVSPKCKPHLQPDSDSVLQLVKAEEDRWGGVNGTRWSTEAPITHSAPCPTDDLTSRLKGFTGSQLHPQTTSTPATHCTPEKGRTQNRSFGLIKNTQLYRKPEGRQQNHKTLARCENNRAGVRVSASQT